MKKLINIILIFICSFILFSCNKKSNDNEPFEILDYEYGVFLGASPSDIEYMKQFHIIVIDAQYYTNSEIEELKGNDNIVYSYINVGALENFRDYYDTLIPACLIIYDRVAYFEPDGDLRLTIDFNPRYRFDNLNLDTSMEGISLLPEGGAILEVKVQDAFPLWLSKILDEGKIYKASFSKYGEAYKQSIINKERKM